MTPPMFITAASAAAPAFLCTVLAFGQSDTDKGIKLIACGIFSAAVVGLISHFSARAGAAYAAYLLEGTAAASIAVIHAKQEAIAIQCIFTFIFGFPAFAGIANLFMR